jgi:hypothetical protein
MSPELAKLRPRRSWPPGAPPPPQPAGPIPKADLGDLLTHRAVATAAYYKVLKLLYRWLEDEDELPASPMAKMRPPIVPDRPVPVITDDGLCRLLAACAGKGSRAAGTPP